MTLSVHCFWICSCVFCWPRRVALFEENSYFWCQCFSKIVARKIYPLRPLHAGGGLVGGGWHTFGCARVIFFLLKRVTIATLSPGTRATSGPATARRRRACSWVRSPSPTERLLRRLRQFGVSVSLWQFGETRCTIYNKSDQQVQVSSIQPTQIGFPNVGYHSKAGCHSWYVLPLISLYYFIIHRTLKRGWNSRFSKLARVTRWFVAACVEIINCCPNNECFTFP